MAIARAVPRPWRLILATGCAVGFVALPPAGARWNVATPPGGQSEPLYTIRPPHLFHHNVGLLEVMVTNVGVVGNPFMPNVYGAAWKEGEYLFAASLWIGAVATDNLAHVSTGLGYAGSREPETELLPPIDGRYTIQESYEGSNGGNRAGFSANAGDDDLDGFSDEDFHNLRDDDGDGRIDEDYEAISQQMFSCEYWDNVDETRDHSPDHRPLNLHVRQRSFAWSDPAYNEFVGFDYTVINEGWEVLQDIYLGYFVDSDAGRRDVSTFYSDDGGGLTRIDTTYVDRSINYTCVDRRSGRLRDCRNQDLHVDIAYMFDWPGSAPGGNSADDLPVNQRGYFGGMFLGHTTDPFGEGAPARVGIHTLAFFSGNGTYPEGDPNNDSQRYDLLQRGTVPARPTGQPGDYRYCFSAGPFRELLPGEELEFQVAFVAGLQLTGMRNNSLMAQRVFNGQWRDLDDNPWTGCSGRETCLHIERGGDPLHWLDPCDSLAPPEGPFKNTACDDPGVWRDADCSCCTPIQSGPCMGLETLVHWVGSIAPPPPSTNFETPEIRQIETIAGDREVRLEWDNASELLPDPLSGEFRFSGYRIWRVEGWRRPLGSVGPAPHEWQLLGTLTREPVGAEMDLDDYTDTTVSPIDTLPGPGGRPLYRFPIGRYFYDDRQGLKNGMLYFYDIVAYSSWFDADGTRHVMDGQAASREVDALTPTWSNAPAGSWRDQVIVVPNPWHGRAAWDLIPSDADPTGTKIAFARLPQQDCTLRIYTLTGDLVRELASGGRGTVFWNMISRNGQDVASGVYLYSVSCDDERSVGRFAIIR
ncbi:MAG: hypothetical protein V1774_02130 [Candidatus Eisenbacteria bacterium]